MLPHGDDGGDSCSEGAAGSDSDHNQHECGRDSAEENVPFQ